MSPTKSWWSYKSVTLLPLSTDFLLLTQFLIEASVLSLLCHCWMTNCYAVLITLPKMKAGECSSTLEPSRIWQFSPPLRMTFNMNAVFTAIPSVKLLCEYSPWHLPHLNVLKYWKCAKLITAVAWGHRGSLSWWLLISVVVWNRTLSSWSSRAPWSKNGTILALGGSAPRLLGKGSFHWMLGK